jgi:hypothetical protein
MDELTLIRDFRSEVPAPSADSVRTARAALAARMSRAPWWRRRLVVAIAVALVAAVGAGAALGLGDRLVDLIRGKPAPETFQQIMDISHGRVTFPGREYVIAGEWRGITATPTPLGPAGIWAAPTKDGELCWHAIVVDPEVTVLHTVLVGGCGPRNWTPSPSMPLLQAGVQRFEDCGPFLGNGKGTGRHYTILVGRAAEPVRRVLVRLVGRQPLRVPVHETFLIALIPEGVQVGRIVAQDARGRRVGVMAPPFTGEANCS